MEIVHIPCLEDNYSYLIIDVASKEAAAVDPVEADKVFMALEYHGVQLKLVLTTHHHWDHSGGNEDMKKLFPGIKVYGGSIDNVKGCTDKLEHGDCIFFGGNIKITSFHTPCHTKGHICFYATINGGEAPAVFTGDTLFIAGCGKFFEGTAEQMYHSLCKILGSLPKHTKVFCGHEYTVKNLQFAQTVEPDNAVIGQKLAWAKQQRVAGLPTIPSSIGEELDTNPFIRVDIPQLQAKLGCKSAIEALGKLRVQKDNWKGR